jgi:hypothetical protein
MGWDYIELSQNLELLEESIVPYSFKEKGEAGILNRYRF